MVKYGRSGNNGRSFDIVTMMRLQETNPAWNRMALIEGWDTLQTGNPTHTNYADQEANFMSRSAAFDEERKTQYALNQVAERKISVENQWGKEKESMTRAAYKFSCAFLAAHYQRNPEIPQELGSRVFVYRKDTDAGMEGVELDVPATVSYCGYGFADKGKLEALLAAEKEMGDNPKVLRELSMKCPQKGNYTVYFSEHKRTVIENKPEIAGSPRANNGRKPRVLDFILEGIRFPT